MLERPAAGPTRSPENDNAPPETRWGVRYSKKRRQTVLAPLARAAAASFDFRRAALFGWINRLAAARSSNDFALANVDSASSGVCAAAAAFNAVRSRERL